MSAYSASFSLYLGDPDVLKVPSFEGEKFGAGDFVLQEGVAIHGQSDALQPLGNLPRTPLEDHLDQTTALACPPRCGRGRGGRRSGCAARRGSRSRRSARPAQRMMIIN